MVSHHPCPNWLIWQGIGDSTVWIGGAFMQRTDNVKYVLYYHLSKHSQVNIWRRGKLEFIDDFFFIKRYQHLKICFTLNYTYPRIIHVQDLFLSGGFCRSSYIDAVMPPLEAVMPVVAMLSGRGLRLPGAERSRTAEPPRPPPDMAEPGREAVEFSRDRPEAGRMG